jgi:hypothetical protein
MLSLSGECHSFCFFRYSDALLLWNPMMENTEDYDTETKQGRGGPYGYSQTET